MSLVRISDSRDWELVDSDQDLRGRSLWDSHGHELGTIDDMVIDTRSERVAAVVLKNGDQFPASDLSVGDDAVYVLNYDAGREMEAGRRRYEGDTLRRRAAAEENIPPARDHRDDRDRRTAEASDRRSYADFTDDFRRHYDSEYGDRGRDYADWEPAYRYGYDMAFEPEFAGRDFGSAEEDLRRGYYQRMGYPMSDRHVWDDVSGAVRRAYEGARE